MSKTIENLKAQVDGLTDAEKADLAEYLLASLEDEVLVREAWRVEIMRRVAEIENGTAVGRPVEEVLAELREEYP